MWSGENNTLFITGTDTHVGKTYVTLNLLHLFAQHNLKTVGLKPIASGCDKNANKIFNQDALAIQAAASVSLTYEEVNPFALQLPIAPHLAAQHDNLALSVANCRSHCEAMFSKYQPDIMVIEGAGGWLVPLNSQETMADLAVALQCGVILVVAIRLGCLNHALLTYQNILARNVPLIGWVANCVDPNMVAQLENIEALKERIQTPCLAVIDYQFNPDEFNAKWWCHLKSNKFFAHLLAVK